MLDRPARWPAGRGRQAAISGPSVSTRSLCAVLLLLCGSAVAQERPAKWRSVELGRSHEGRPIRMELLGDGPQRVLVIAGVHGNEPGGPALARRLGQYLRQHPQLLAGCTVGIVTEVNPDGLARGSRTNAAGVDLNRNYPSSDWRPARPGELDHGRFPASEPETRAVMRAVMLLEPQRIVDIHSITGERQCNNYDGPGHELAELLSGLNGYPVTASIGYATPGCLGSWAGVDNGIPTITLELPRGARVEDCWQVNRVALVAFVQEPGGVPTQPALAGQAAGQAAAGR